MSFDPRVLAEQVHRLDPSQRRVLGHWLQRRQVELLDELLGGRPDVSRSSE